MVSENVIITAFRVNWEYLSKEQEAKAYFDGVMPIRIDS